LAIQVSNLTFLRFTNHKSRITHHASIKHPRINIRPMHSRMAPRAPARALAQKHRVRDFADVDFARGYPGALHLRMAPQTKVRVAGDQQFAVD
jgi:hypothetical protein